MSFSAIKSRFGRGGGTGLSPITISLKDGFVGPSRSACVEELAAAFRGRGWDEGCRWALKAMPAMERGVHRPAI